MYAVLKIIILLFLMIKKIENDVIYVNINIIYNMNILPKITENYKMENYKTLDNLLFFIVQDKMTLGKRLCYINLSGILFVSKFDYNYDDYYYYDNYIYLCAVDYVTKFNINMFEDLLDVSKYKNKASIKKVVIKAIISPFIFLLEDNYIHKYYMDTFEKEDSIILEEYVDIVQSNNNLYLVIKDLNDIESELSIYLIGPSSSLLYSIIVEYYYIYNDMLYYLHDDLLHEYSLFDKTTNTYDGDFEGPFIIYDNIFINIDNFKKIEIQEH